jgi:enoyl-[acyl-carrier protein] reductase I
MGNLLSGKNILVMGVRNKWSIAWGIINSAKSEGANIIITYQGDREKGAAEDLAEAIGGAQIYKCDITEDNDIKVLFDNIKNDCSILHGVVHSIAHAKTEDLQTDFVNTSRDGFAHAMNVSAYSLVAVARHAKDLMTDGGSILTLTYMGSEKVFPGYNIMGVAKAALEATVRYLAHDLGSQGIRVNAISAGPIKTLSAKGVKDLGSILDAVEKKAPLGKNIDQAELGDASLYYLSHLSRATTGEVTHVDSGYNIMGI